MRTLLIAATLASLGATMARAEPVQLDESGLEAVAAGTETSSVSVDPNDALVNVINTNTNTNTNTIVAVPVVVNVNPDVSTQVETGVAVGVDAAVAAFRTMSQSPAL